ncbi:protein dachsous [Bacillus rossius redtenbacheri]|uniref:protein dachsous n=1 Tax=Bacillus rossius redtenbacheri TaxID=93214 RepID=UPI002FDE485C
MPAPLLAALLLALAAPGGPEHVREMEVSEGAPVGTRVGFIGDGSAGDESGPPYLIIPVPGSAVDSDLAVEQTTGEIRTKVPLDREARSSYSLVAIPLAGENVRVVVRVLDENDNAPTFPSPVMSIEFPENTPRDVKRTLHPARDLDLGVYNTQRYNIVSGNVNNAFRLSSHRERDGVLYLDLQINGFLDRESIAAYSLVIEALDGGSPPLRGLMTVNITIQDVNDNQPIFSQNLYTSSVPENATVGTSVLQVFATDTDAGLNGEVEYSINRRQSDRDGMFRIDGATGLIAVNRPLDFETKDVHELVVVARDKGEQPLETTAFVSIKVTDVNDNQPTINVIFLSDDATPKISESAQPGEFVARISVNDPDSKTEYSNVNVTLEGGDGKFGLATRDNIIYLVIVANPLDRELQPNYTLSVIATDTGNPPLHASRTFHLLVTDVNDNAPEFERASYHADVLEVAEPGTSVVRVQAFDKDEGNNSAVVYSIADDPDGRASWFRVDAHSGVVTTRSHVDCEADPMPRVVVVAVDNGVPPLSSSATVTITIHDVNDNEPIFDQSFYNVSVPENEAVGHCIIKVSATDPDCGVNALVNYTLGDGLGRARELEVRPTTGEVCVAGVLDFEARAVYEFPVVATDRGGLSTTAMVKVQLLDVNDNPPRLYPRLYNVSLREGEGSTAGPLVTVAASDPDSGRYGAVSFSIAAGNEAGVFRVDKNTGELFVARPGQLSSRSTHHLNISATDGGGLRAPEDAEVYLSVADAAHSPPAFERPRYAFSVREDVARGASVGAVRAASDDVSPRCAARYSIYSGDPDGLFAVDAVSGVVRTAAPLDHETRAAVLLNVMATCGEPPAYGHSQVHIAVEDVNDNSPEFDSRAVRVSVPEDARLGAPLYSARARDRDSGRNGAVRYRLASTGPGLFGVDPRQGHLVLLRPLDYESAQRHTVVVVASDSGEPPRSANLTVVVEVQDVNDNPPVFQRAEYSVSVLESLPVDSQVVQVSAVDLDTGNNARLTYRLLPGDDNSSAAAVFGVSPNSGWVFLRRPLDREARDRYALRVLAADGGSPPGSATARVSVTVLDANDNDPAFSRAGYEFCVEENRPRGAWVGRVDASDPDLGPNGAVRYSLIPANSSFSIHPVTGEITTRAPLDRELRARHELVAEARDQGSPPRGARVAVSVRVADVNDNPPELVDPREDVVSVREEQPAGTEVVRLRAVDRDAGENATVTYSLLKGRDSDGHGVFSVDPLTGVVRTTAALDHEDKAIYRLEVAAADGGSPPRQSARLLRVEVLDLNDNRPTFTSSSLVFRVSEDVKVGHVVGTVATSDPGHLGGGHVSYTLTSVNSSEEEPEPEDNSVLSVFEMDRTTGSLVVARQLDRETRAEYRLEVRALDTSASNNPQSSAVSVRVEVTDVNDNPPRWARQPLVVPVPEDAPVGAAVWNFTATDADSGADGELRYGLARQWPARPPHAFSVDPLTGTLTLRARLDRESAGEYVLVVRASDRPDNATGRLQSSLTARVVVRDANDNPPVFVSPPAGREVRVREGWPAGAPLCHVLAADRDEGENGRVTYELSSGDPEGVFRLDRDSGALSLARAPAAGGIAYELNVTASDHGAAPLRAHRLVRVVVLGAAGSPPRFPRAEYRANVSEDAGVGAFVVKVTARDGSGGNLSYSIPPGAAEDRFAVDARSGAVTVRRPLDREARDLHAVPVFASDEAHAHAAVATVLVAVGDANDHAPEFPPGACYPLDLPENSDLAVVHTVVAADRDSGANAEITYTITGGNAGNRFSLDPHSGELTARPLDREAAPRYRLHVTAQDRGALRASCNVSVRVDDQNDSDPAFALPGYSATVPEGAPAGTTVLVVRASDADLGANALLAYSLANESDWLFRVDNRTGAVTTAGPLDHERQSSYAFHVVATDGGRYDARSQRVPVHVQVTDANDNRPVFARYPFSASVPAYTQPGQTLVRVAAHDADQGANSEVVYSLVNEPAGGKFRINPTSGAVSAASSLAPDSGRLFRLRVLARDKGNPPQSSTGLVEIRVGDGPEAGARLHFQNSTYRAQLEEGAARGTEVLQVSAVRTDGRRQRITYSIGAGNDDGAFDVDGASGAVRVRDPRALDYERARELRLSLAAEGEAADGSVFGYCEVHVSLLDRNDNAPRFTQEQYVAAVWEGNNKGTFVMQVTAVDADEDGNSHVLYHIVDGNHDNAFVIEPPFSGLVKTNIVLDREIRDTYRLTVIATDEGNPQLTGTATLRVTIIDVNDNPPTFPPHSVITVSEGTEVGAVLTTVRANDVDSNPALTYHFADWSADTGEPERRYREARAAFSMDRFSGKVTLVRRLDYEARREYRLRVAVSDSAHSALTELRVRVRDENDNRPRFSSYTYLASLPPDGSDPSRPLLAVNATDADSGENGRVRYSLLPPAPRGFLVDPVTGAMYANRSAVGGGRADVQLAVVAADSGRPELSDVATVTVTLGAGGGQAAVFLQREYRVRVREDAPRGTVIHKITTADQFSEESRNVVFHIIDGNPDGVFHVISPTGELVLLKTLDREAEDSYTLRVAAGDRNSSAAVVRVTVDDANDNPPVFQPAGAGGFSASVSEGAGAGHSVLRLAALDADQPGSPNSEVVYEIASGNDEDLFSLDLKTGIIRVNKGLDYDSGDTQYVLVVQATDSAISPDTRLTNIATVSIQLEDDNDNSPVFPVPEYLQTVPENEPAGTAVFTATATDADRGQYGAVNYSVVPSQGLEDSWRLFRVDPVSGVVTTAAVFDYEQRSRYTFTLQARDFGGREANVRVRVDVEGRDEFHPQFTERTYRFALPSTRLPAGHILGHVSATDRDKGPDGRVVYQLTTQHSYFKVNRTTGALMVRRKLDESFAPTEDISLVVTASSGWQGSLTNMTVVEITLDPLPKRDNELLGETLPAAGPGGLADWALGLLVTLVLIVLALGAIFLFLHMRNRRHKKGNKPALSSGGGGADGFVDPSGFDTIPIRGSGAPGGPGVQGVPPGSQFAPPKYDEIPPYPPVHRGGAGNNNSASSNSGAATSELSGSEQSGSSGRGSAEDGEDVEDEEIRMINEGGAGTGGRDNAGLDEDNLSDVSVRNTQEYLARLGIMVVDNPVTASGPPPPPPPPLNGLHMFDEEGGGEADIANLIYAKLNDGGSASGGGSEDGGGGGALEHAMVLSGFGDVPTHHQPSMTGSLSSIVHSEEELTGSYNWDYLLDWGPQYQPLAHVFSEIARLKDDAASVHSANSASSSGAGKGKLPPAQPIPPHPKNVPPPLLTSVAPRSLAVPRIGHLSSSVAGSMAPASHRTSSLLALPRSPISHDATGQGFSTSTAMSPSFSPSLSPLATRSPSISPLVTPGVSLPRQNPQTQRTDPTELRI